MAALGHEQADADMAQLKKQPTDRHVRASVVRRCWPGLLQQVAAKAAAKEEEASKKAARAAAKGRRKKVRCSYTPRNDMHLLARSSECTASPTDCQPELAPLPAVPTLCNGLCCVCCCDRCVVSFKVQCLPCPAG